jgi:prolyl 4-hydroxylase
MPNLRLAKIGRSVKERLTANPHVKAVEIGGLTLYFYQNFMTPEECATMIDLVHPRLEPSELLLARGQTNNGFRTSSSGNLERFDPFVNSIDKRIADLLGLRESQGETAQGQVYKVGQVFKPHHDYFHRSMAYWEEQRFHGGQRSWTTMVYLDTPDGGGETQFPTAGFKVSPRQGVLLAWNNMDEEGEPNELTLHESLPVTAGTKTIITKWFRGGDWHQG